MPEFFHSYRQMGRVFAERYGISVPKTFDETVVGLGHERLVVALLSAIHESLTEIRRGQLSAMPQEPPRMLRPGDPSDGMLRAIQIGMGKTPLSMDFVREFSLSVRARKVLQRAIREEGLQMVEDLTADRLRVIRGCGPTTKKEILEWKEQVLRLPLPYTPS